MDKTLVSASELDAMKSEQTVIIDTRAPEEYAKGHIPGALNIRDIL